MNSFKKQTVYGENHAIIKIKDKILRFKNFNF